MILRSMLFYDTIMILDILSPLSTNLDTSEEWLGLHSQFPLSLPKSALHSPHLVVN